MLTKVDPGPRHVRGALASGVEILSVASAVPSYKVTQDEVAWRAQKVYPQYARLDSLYTNTGIDTRYACEPREWYLEPRTWEERTASFQRHSMDLLEKVALTSIEAAGLSPSDIDVLVVEYHHRARGPEPRSTPDQSTAIQADCRAPADLRSRLRRRRRRPRTISPHGASAAGLARAVPDNRSLLAVFARQRSVARDVRVRGLVRRRRGRQSCCGAEAKPRLGASPARGRVGAAGDYSWSKTEHIMGWDIKNDGFGVVLSPELPTLMRERLGEALNGFLDTNDLTLEDFDGFLFHPGGRKVLDTAEEVLGVPRAKLEHSWGVLRDFGNMSSATAIFVLERAIASGARGRHLLAAFGPGFSAYFVVLDL